MIYRRGSFVGALLAFSSLFVGCDAQAAYALPTPPFGWGGSAGAWTYGGTASANAPWINGSAAAQVTVNVGGRPVTVPATMRLASNAGQFIARQGLLTQAIGRSVPFIAWALAAGWVWDQVSQRWMAPDGGPAYMPGSTYWFIAGSSGQALGPASTAADACTSLAADLTAGSPTHSYAFPGASLSIYQGRCYFFARYKSNGTVYDDNYNSGRSPYPDTYNGPQVGGGVHVATNDDADDLGGTAMPDGLPDVADDVVGLPQALPEVQPWRVPVGEPVAIPYTNPQEWQQPVVSIVPAAEPAQPFRVDIQPGWVTSVNGGSIPSTGEAADEGPAAVPDEQPSLCEENPDASACQPLGQPPTDTVVIPTQNINLEMPNGPSFGPDNAACPSPRILNTSLAGPLEFTFEGACTFADGIRPVVIGLAYLSAALMFFGIGSRD